MPLVADSLKLLQQLRKDVGLKKLTWSGSKNAGGDGLRELITKCLVTLGYDLEDEYASQISNCVYHQVMCNITPKGKGPKEHGVSERKTNLGKLKKAFKFAEDSLQSEV